MENPIIVSKIISQEFANGLVQVNVDGLTFGNTIGKVAELDCEEQVVGSATNRKFIIDGVTLYTVYQYNKAKSKYVTDFYMANSDAKNLLSANTKQANIAFGVNFSELQVA